MEKMSGAMEPIPTAAQLAQRPPLNILFLLKLCPHSALIPSPWQPLCSHLLSRLGVRSCGDHPLAQGSHAFFLFTAE